MDQETLYMLSSGPLDEDKSIAEIFDLTGKVAVVSGTLGLALHVIYRLASCGAKVVCGSRNEESGALLVADMKERGLDVSFKKTDVSKVSDCEALVKFAEETYGHVDIVVPVAAVWDARAFVDMEEETWDKIIDVEGGKVVTIASVAHRGDDMAKIAMMTPYNAAKAGVVGMTKGIARELKQYGINVNCIAPGGMLTPGAMMNGAKPSALYGSEFDADVMKYGKGTPVASSPDQVALMILTMCTDVSDFMYGQLIEVDGGSQFSFQEKPWSYTMEGGICAH